MPEEDLFISSDNKVSDQLKDALSAWKVSGGNKGMATIALQAKQKADATKRQLSQAKKETKNAARKLDSSRDRLTTTSKQLAGKVDAGTLSQDELIQRRSDAVNQWIDDLTHLRQAEFAEQKAEREATNSFSMYVNQISDLFAEGSATPAKRRKQRQKLLRAINSDDSLDDQQKDYLLNFVSSEAAPGLVTGTNTIGQASYDFENTEFKDANSSVQQTTFPRAAWSDAAAAKKTTLN